MGSWSKSPLFERNELKNDTLLSLTGKDEMLRKRLKVQATQNKKL
jgi:hypothetical protein